MSFLEVADRAVAPDRVAGVVDVDRDHGGVAGRARLLGDRGGEGRRFAIDHRKGDRILVEPGIDFHRLREEGRPLAAVGADIDAVVVQPLALVMRLLVHRIGDDREGLPAAVGEADHELGREDRGDDDGDRDPGQVFPAAAVGGGGRGGQGGIAHGSLHSEISTFVRQS